MKTIYSSMEAEAHFDSENNIIEVSWAKSVSLTQYINTTNEIINITKKQSHVSWLFDRRKLVKMDAQSRDWFKKNVLFRRDIMDKVSVFATVLPSDDFAISAFASSMVGYLKLILPTLKAETFEDYEKAKSWILNNNKMKVAF